MNTKNIRFLVEMMEKSSLTAMEIEEEDCKIRLERNVPVSYTHLDVYKRQNY